MGDKEYVSSLKREFKPDELAVVRLVIDGPEDPEGQRYTFKDIDKVNLPDGGEVSLEAELWKVLSLVALIGKRVVEVVVDGKFLQISVDIVTDKKRIGKMRRRIRFKIIENSGVNVRLHGAKSRKIDEDQVDEMELTKRSPRFFSGVPRDKRAPIPRAKLPALQGALTEQGSVSYNPQQSALIYDYLKRFQESYAKAVMILGGI